MIRAFDHSGDSERLSLSIGGPRFSGELLVSAPVVRECSRVVPRESQLSQSDRLRSSG
jgi:hypothetical protein